MNYPIGGIKTATKRDHKSPSKAGRKKATSRRREVRNRENNSRNVEKRSHPILNMTPSENEKADNMTTMSTSPEEW